MKAYLLNILFLSFCLLLFAGKGTAQRNQVKFKFEIDAKVIKEKAKILLYIDGAIIEPEMLDNSFTVPLEIQGREFIGVRFISDKYDLYFDDVSVNSLKSDWDIGVDYKPFEKENINPERSYKNIAYIYYLKFDRFAITIEVNKSKNPIKNL